MVGRTGDALCPVSALAQYISMRGCQPGAFFLDTSRKVLTKQRFVERIRELLTTIGLPQHNFAGHIFRIGAATTAAAAGIEDSTIQTLGRWHSAAFLQYIRTPQLFHRPWLELLSRANDVELTPNLSCVVVCCMIRYSMHDCFSYSVDMSNQYRGCRLVQQLLEVHYI